MKEKWTKGPWKHWEYAKPSETDCGEIEFGVQTNYPEALCNGARSVAIVTGGHYTRTDQKDRLKAIAENEANARLIALSPEWPEVVRNLLTDYLWATRNRHNGEPPSVTAARDLLSRLPIA